MKWLGRSLVYEMSIDYNSSHLRQYGFASGQIYTELTRIQGLIQGQIFDITLRLVINSNPQVEGVLKEFMDGLPNTRFYSKHPKSHFLQLEDYPAAESRSLVRVPASPTLNHWSEYTTTYGYAAIYEHEIAVKKRETLRGSTFKLRIMQIPGSKDIFFVGFIEKPADLKVRFDIIHSIKMKCLSLIRMLVSTFLIDMVKSYRSLSSCISSAAVWGSCSPILLQNN